MQFSDFENASVEAKNRVQALANRVYGKSIDKLDKEQVVHLIDMAMSIGINKVTIRVSETRRTSVQFCTNVYEQVAEIDFTQVWSIIRDEIKAAENPLNKFLELSKVFHEFLTTKIEQYNQTLKEAIRNEQSKDKIEQIPNSRFASKD